MFLHNNRIREIVQTEGSTDEQESVILLVFACSFKLENCETGLLSLSRITFFHVAHIVVSSHFNLAAAIDRTLNQVLGDSRM